MEVRRTPETRHDNAPSFLQSPRLDPTAVAIEDTGSSVARLAAWKAERVSEEAPAFNWYCGYRNVNTN